MPQKSSDRPLPVTILAVFVLCITSWNGIRIYSTLVNWQILRDFDANPVYILGTGFFWALAGLGLFWLFWEGRQFSFRAVLARPVGCPALTSYQCHFQRNRICNHIRHFHSRLAIAIIESIF
jgi:hypothetical protein